MPTETTHIHTLTAEVRVLMIGTRQVTMGIWRQLDWIDPEDIDPFGRVNDEREGGLLVIGRNPSDGQLVRATGESETMSRWRWEEWKRLGREPGEYLPTHPLTLKFRRLPLIVLAGAR